MYKCIKTFISINTNEYIKDMEIFFLEYSELGYGETQNFILVEIEEIISL